MVEGKTYADAVEYYLTLNDKGIAATNTFIGEAYLNGEGVEKDIISARRWFEKGNGAEENMKKGIMLMGRAFDSNYLRACEYLGELYYIGEDVDANVEETVRWQSIGTRLNGAKSHFYFSYYILLGYIDGDKSDALYNAKRAKELGDDPVPCDWLQLKINGEMQE